MTMILDGSLGVTFPVVAATGSAVQASSGRVLQVVNVTYGTSSSTTSTSFVDTGLTASITPSNSASKILVFVSGVYQSYVASGSARDTGGAFQLARGSAGGIWSPNTITNYIEGGVYATFSFNTVNNFIINYLDSPSTTSSTAYKLQFYALSGRTFAVNPAGTSAPCVITLMEISA